MQTENHFSAGQQSVVTYLRLLVVLALVFVSGAAVFAVLALNKLGRVVTMVENVNAKVDRAVEAAAPLGKAAVEKGVAALDAVNSDDLGESATEGVKEIGRAAKQKAIDAIRQKRTTGANAE